jgi:hypothetical protein
VDSDVKLHAHQLLFRPQFSFNCITHI